MSDLFEAMRIYCRVAESGGFSSAARSLDLAQSQVSRAVMTLEARLGVKLISRTTRRHALTPEGHEYFLRCQAILKAVEAADESVGNRSNSISGLLRVFAPVSLGRSLIIPRMYEFMDRHPALDVHLLMDDRPWDLVEHGIDVSIRIGPLREKMLSVRKLGQARRVVVASPHYWNSRGRPTSPDELADREAIVFRGPITVDQCEFKKQTIKVTVTFSGRLTTNSSEAILASLLLGRGFTVAPWWLVANDVANGNLEVVLKDWEVDPPFELFATFPESHTPPMRVQRFVDWLVYSWTLDDHIRL